MKSEKSRIELLSEFDAAPASALFDQQAVAAVRGCSEATMERDRWAGGGVPFLKIGRLVRYRKSDVLAWLEDHPIRQSTSKTA